MVETLAVMTEVVGSSPFIGKNVPHFSFFNCYFIACKQLCELESQVYDKKLFDKKHCRQTSASVLSTPYSPLIYTDLFVNAKPKHSQNMNHTINTVVI